MKSKTFSLQTINFGMHSQIAITTVDGKANINCNNFRCNSKSSTTIYMIDSWEVAS